MESLKTSHKLFGRKIANPLSRLLSSLLIAFLLGLSLDTCQSQTSSALTPHVSSTSKDIKALMLSDVHFDPFEDPEKALALSKNPVSRWDAILSEPPSRNHVAASWAVKEKCEPGEAETGSTVWRSSLDAMRMENPHPAVIVVTGDFVVHQFVCRYRFVTKDESEVHQRAFLVNVMRYVLYGLRRSFPGVPIYSIVGNNDSSCGDYRFDDPDATLSLADPVIAEFVPSSQRHSVSAQLAAHGSYAIAIPGTQNLKLIMLNDTSLSAKYRTCHGETNAEPSKRQMDWLHEQLEQARTERTNVWVTSHIPFGIDPYATFESGDICATRKPVQFLSSDALPRLMETYADIVKLGIFAHTHSDEVRFLPARGDSVSRERAQGIPIKFLPSISPSTALPSFTIGKVSAKSGVLEDYSVYVASPTAGKQNWSLEYSYRNAFGESAYSGQAVEHEVATLKADPEGKSSVAQSYMRFYARGNTPENEGGKWPKYTCALDHFGNDEYLNCACPTRVEELARPDVIR